MLRHRRPARRARRIEADREQLDLFAASGPVAAPARRPEQPRAAAGSSSIPSACPVTGTAVCYRGDCRHYHAGGCVHPDAHRAAGTRSRRP